MNQDKLIILDIDGVTADLHPVWASELSKRFGVQFDWTMMVGDWQSKHFPLRQKGQLYAPLTEYIYAKVQPMPGALNGVKELRAMGYKIFWATALVHNAPHYEKLGWLDKNGFEPGENYVEIKNKGIFDKRAVMIDDYTKNCDAHMPGFSLLFDRPWNHVRRPEQRVATSWSEIVEAMA